MRRQFGPLFGLMLLTFAASATAAPVETYSDGNSGRMYAIRVTPPALTGQSARQSSTPAILKATADAFIEDNLQLIGITDPATELLAAAPETDQLGLSRVHYFQRWHGLDVLGGEITVHLNKDGQVHYVKTKVAKGLPVDTTPSFGENAAQNDALHLALDDTQNAIAPTVLKSRLIVLPLGILKNEPSTTSSLAWEVTVVDDETGGDHWGRTYFYDARAGSLLFQLSGMAGFSPVTREAKDCARNANPCEMNIEDPLFPGYFHGRSEGMPPRGPFPNPAYPVFYGSTDVDSVYAYLGALHAYYSITFGINGPNGFGGTAIFPNVAANITRGVVHNDGSGFQPPCPYGAQMSSTTGTLIFCRGVVTPDVAGHEYAHTIVQHSFHDANGRAVGATYYGESGALNEAYADVMGEVFEHAYTGTTDWKEATSPPALSGVYRDLTNPPSRPFYAGGPPYPDRHYAASIICDSQDAGGVHGNSTVVSHAIYLFSEGGDFNGCTIVGQGKDAAQKVFFRGWRTYFSQNETFQEAYTDLIQACTDLYPASTVAELTKALQAAEMDQPGRCSGIPEAPVPCAVSGVASIPPPATASLRIISANPTKDAARFSYFTSRSGHVEVRVHDLMGRVVANPVDEYHVAGDQVGAWDGRLPNGESAPGGIYFLSVALDKQVLGTAKLVVVR